MCMRVGDAFADLVAAGAVPAVYEPLVYLELVGHLRVTAHGVAILDSRAAPLVVLGAADLVDDILRFHRMHRGQEAGASRVRAFRELGTGHTAARPRRSWLLLLAVALICCLVRDEVRALDVH